MMAPTSMAGKLIADPFGNCCSCDPISAVWTQSINLANGWHGFTEFDMPPHVYSFQGSIDHQAKVRRRYLIRTSDFDYTSEDRGNTSYNHEERYTGAGFCPQITGSPASITFPPPDGEATQNGVGTLFETEWGVLAMSSGGSEVDTYETGATVKSWVGQIFEHFTEPPNSHLLEEQTIVQTYSAGNVTSAVRTALSDAINGLDWSGFSSSWPEYRVWEFDQYPDFTVTGTLDTASLDPDDYDGTVGTSFAAGFSNSNSYPDLKVIPGNGSDQRAILFSGWVLVMYPTTTITDISLSAVRTRFRVEGGSITYWIGRAHTYFSGILPDDVDYEHLLGPVEVLSSGTADDLEVIEIPFPDVPGGLHSSGFFEVMDAVPEPRLSIGRGCFAILGETPEEWAARTGYELQP